MPTYLTYVWHTTGRTIRTASGPRPIWESQPSFGLFVAYDGPLQGWNYRLASDTKTVESGKASSFQIQVPASGSIHLNTLVEAIEPTAEQPGGTTEGTCPGNWSHCSGAQKVLLIAVILAVILVLVFVVRRKRK